MVGYDLEFCHSKQEVSTFFNGKENAEALELTYVVPRLCPTDRAGTALDEIPLLIARVLLHECKSEADPRGIGDDSCFLSRIESA